MNIVENSPLHCHQRNGNWNHNLISLGDTYQNGSVTIIDEDVKQIELIAGETAKHKIILENGQYSQTHTILLQQSTVAEMQAWAKIGKTLTEVLFIIAPNWKLSKCPTMVYSFQRNPSL